MKIQIEKLGWVVAGGLAAVMFASGFDAPATKVGVVDVTKAITSSDGYKRGGDDITAAYKQRQDLLEFLNAYPVFTVSRANRFRELSLKPTPTAAETAELNKIKSDVKDDDAKLRTLQQKASPTAADKAALDDYGKRGPEIAGLIAKWRQEFTDELNAVQEKAQTANQDTLRAAIQDIGKNQAFSLIFVKDMAPFGQNDVTADVIKAMNKK